jgi:hypothetical protein
MAHVPLDSRDRLEFAKEQQRQTVCEIQDLHKGKRATVDEVQIEKWFTRK